MDIWNNEYVQYRDDRIKHYVTFLEDDPECDDWEYNFKVQEGLANKILMIEDEALLYQIKALRPIKGKTVAIEYDNTPGVYEYIITETI